MLNKAFFREILLSVFMAAVFFLLLQNTVQTCVILSSSMEPDLQVGQRLIISKVTYHIQSPQRGDIVVFQPPQNQDVIPYIKRIIGLPGDIIEIKNGNVYVNGEPLIEPYIKENPDYYMPPEIVSADSYFVLGDNRNNSYDSHIWGTVPQDSIIGKASLSIWPLTDWGLAPNYSFEP